MFNKASQYFYGLTAKPQFIVVRNVILDFMEQQEKFIVKYDSVPPLTDT